MSNDVKTRRAVHDLPDLDCPNCGRHKTFSDGSPLNFQYLLPDGTWTKEAFCSKVCFKAWVVSK